jgi:hypothetical protein
VTFQRDPLSEWFDLPAQRLLRRAYADYGQWVTTWVPQPTRQQRGVAAAMLVDVDEPDDNEHTRWLRAFKRSARWNLRMYGYARELRPGQVRLGSRSPLTLMSWDSTTGLVLRPNAKYAYEVRVKLFPNTADPLYPAPIPADDITKR